MPRPLTYALLSAILSTSLLAPPMASASKSPPPCFVDDLFKAPDSNRERIIRERWTAPLEQILESTKDAKDIDDLVEKMATNDNRGAAFNLEGAYKFYAAHPRFKAQAEMLEGWRAKFKRLEDGIGWYRDDRKFAKEAAELGLEAEAVGYARIKAEAKRQNLRRVLLEDGWYNPKSHKDWLPQRVMDDLDKLDWPSQAEDHTFVAERFAQKLKKVENTDFDVNDLQGGFHKMRRELRWFLIYINLMRGKIEIKGSSMSKDLLPLLVGDVQALQQYLDIFIDEGVKHPVYIPEGAYRALSNAVERAGRFKDDGELISNTVEALYRDGTAGISEEEAKAKAAEILKAKDKYHPYLDNAKAIQAQIEDAKLLSTIRKYVEKQLH